MRSRTSAGVLDAAGVGFADVVKTTVFLADMDDFAAVNAVYARLPGPAAGPLDGRRRGAAEGASVEIEVVAVHKPRARLTPRTSPPMTMPPDLLIDSPTTRSGPA